MLPQITKAVVTTAGFGTRFLPITKTVQKEMLPILNRPLVDYVVQDLLAAGITEIIFVISEHNTQILHFYSKNPRLQEYLESRDKHQIYETEIAHLHTQARFRFVRQPDDGRYGTAVPVDLCREYLQDEDAFLVYMGDDFLYTPGGESAAQAMIKQFVQANATGLVTCVPREDSELHKYGIAEVREQDGQLFLQRLVEKPQPGQAPSNLSNVSKYVLTPAIFDIIANQSVNEQSGELYITDSVQELAQMTGRVVVHQTQCEYLDGGNPLSWLKANIRLALDDPSMRDELLAYITQEARS